MFGDQRRIDTQQSGLDFVGVGDDTAGDVGRRTGPIGEAGGEHAGGTRLRGRDAPPGQQSGDLFVDGGTVLGEDGGAVPFADQFHQGVVPPGRVRFVAGDHLHLAASQAGGDFQAGESGHGLLCGAQGFGQAGLGHSEHPNGVLAVGGPSGDGLPHRIGGHGGRPHALQFLGRAGENHNRRCARDHHAGGGAHRIQHLSALGDHRLLAIGGPHRVGVDIREARHPALHDRGDLLFHRLVEHQLALTEPGDDGHRHIVGGRPQTARGHDEVHPFGTQEPQLRLDVGRAVTADGDMRQFDAQLQEPVGHPGPVAVGHPTRQHFGTGDQNPCSCAHRLRAYGAICAALWPPGIGRLFRRTASDTSAPNDSARTAASVRPRRE